MEKCCTDLGRVGGSKVCSKGVQHDNCSESRKMNIQSWQSSEVKKMFSLTADGLRGNDDTEGRESPSPPSNQYPDDG